MPQYCRELRWYCLIVLFPYDFPKDIPGGKQASFSLDPQLVLESGMHPTELNRISVDKRGELLVTGHEESTALLWDLKQQLLLRTLRPPLGIQQSERDCWNGRKPGLPHLAPCARA